jgi:tryptophanyl-tRNA synthetase
MNRMTQFKEKAGKNVEAQSLGLYAYPSLMAADILLYHATHVPVGEDQKQHVELTRDIAQKFNHDYKVDFFPLTTPVIEGPAMRVMNLRNGTKKMSKSGESDMERINMTDDATTIARKLQKARTDATPLPETVEGLEGRPEARNLVDIYAALSDLTPGQVLERFPGAGWGTFKPLLAELAVERLSPISTEMARLMADPAEIDRLLARGAERARALAAPILERTYDIVGIVRG